MSGRFDEEDLGKIKRISITDRRSKVKSSDFVDPEDLKGIPPSSSELRAFLPGILAGKDLIELVDAMRKARQNGKEILWLIGAHVIKCGLSLYIRSLMRNGFITALAATGSSVVHDLELSFFGETSEDVGEELPRGRFGMARETVEHFCKLTETAEREKMGLGEAVGHYIQNAQASHKEVSIFGEACRSAIPCTVHVAFGTDIVHQHPEFPASSVGALTMKDFRVLAKVVGKVFDGGVVIVFGSAVVLPEVFLKAVSIEYNLGAVPKDVTVAAFDMVKHYRVMENVIRRPFGKSARSYHFTGHHELMLPLMYLLLAPE